MADVTVTAALVRPLQGAICLPVVLGGTLVPGEPFYISDKDNGRPVVIRADANVSAAVARNVGVLVAIGGGKATGVIGDVGTGVFLGPVTGFSSLTPGANYYISDNAGKIADTLATYDRIVGYAMTDTTLFVFPQVNDPSCA